MTLCVRRLRHSFSRHDFRIQRILSQGEMLPLTVNPDNTQTGHIEIRQLGIVLLPHPRFRNGNSIKEAMSIMKPKHIFISILAVLFVFPLMGTFAQQAPNSGSIEVIMTFDYPGAGNLTLPQKINERGDSVGGTLTLFSVPAAVATLAYDINDSNQLLVGYYIDSSGILHGYYRDANGALHFPIDPSGSTGTILFGLNDKNWVVGRYADSSGVTHGLFFVPPNQFFTFDYPGSTFTSLNGINDQGLICGRYVDASGIAHGIIARVTGTPPTNAAGPEMKAFASPSRVTPLNSSPSAWGDAMPAR